MTGYKQTLLPRTGLNTPSFRFHDPELPDVHLSCISHISKLDLAPHLDQMVEYLGIPLLMRSPLAGIDNPISLSSCGRARMSCTTETVKRNLGPENGLARF